MRRTSDVSEVLNALSCVLFASDSTGGSGYGVTIDTNGFEDILAVICAGSIGGTAASTGDLIVHFEESADGKTSFTDITDGAVNGSMKTTIRLKGHTAATTPQNYQAKLYERLHDGTRKRYLRCHASLVGTAASGYFGGPINVAVILGRPSSTLYVQSPASIGSGNVDMWKGYTVNSYKP